jgi:LacI family transcriptional regulator
MRIIQENGFVPNVTATGLAGGKTRLVGVLTPPFTWPAIPEILRGVAEYIEDASYEIVLYSIRLERSHTDILDRILPMRMISGLMAILPGELAYQLGHRFHEGMPIVLIDDQEKPADIPWVGIDNVTGAYQATKHLLSLGHRRIAYIEGPQNFACVVERRAGYLQALQEAGISADPTLIFQGRFDVPSGRECASELFSRERDAWPSAIFASNDQMAYGTLEIAEERGIRIPEDVALMGFDDNLLSAHMKPPLTTMRQPFFEMGRTAIELLLTMVDPDHLTSKEKTPPRPDYALDYIRTGHLPRIELPTSLVVRSSCGAVPPRS